jgi:hypothetical protein
MQDLPPELYEIFRQSLKTTLGLLDKVVQERDLAAMSFHAHAMRGTSASYGYGELSREAGVVEDAADGGHWEAAAAAYAVFRDSAQDVLRSLESGS